VGRRRVVVSQDFHRLPRKVSACKTVRVCVRPGKDSKGRRWTYWGTVRCSASRRPWSQILRKASGTTASILQTLNAVRSLSKQQQHPILQVPRYPVRVRWRCYPDNANPTHQFVPLLGILESYHNSRIEVRRSPKSTESPGVECRSSNSIS